MVKICHRYEYRKSVTKGIRNFHGSDYKKITKGIRNFTEKVFS